VESLRSELQQLFASRLEEVLRPLRDEISNIKLWLARMTNQLEGADPMDDHTSVSNMAELFGPCSPVRRSPTLSVLTSLVTACTPTDSSVCEDIPANTTDSVIDEMPTLITAEEIHRETDSIINEVATRTSDKFQEK
jgi:hypothetical protein